MKKLLTLLFVTLFLFTSCKEEVKPEEVETPIDVEENTEVKQPEKIETPTEVEENTEVQTPIQNEEPTEIENPVETEKPTEIESPTEIEQPIEVKTPTEEKPNTEVQQPTNAIEPEKTEIPTDVVEPTETETPTEIITPVLSDKMASVLRDEISFFDTAFGTREFFCSYGYEENFDDDFNYVSTDIFPVNYALADMDGDSKYEILVNGDLIREFEGEVYMYSRSPNRSFWGVEKDVYSDGTFTFTSPEYIDENFYGLGKLEFDGIKLSVVELWKVQINENGEEEYFVEDKSVEKSVLEEYQKQFNAEVVTFSHTKEYKENEYPFIDYTIPESKKEWSGEIAKQFKSGKGTKKEPYIIKTPAELALMAKKVNSGSDVDKYFELGSDIDLSQAEWVPIGNNEFVFKGNFDGKGYTIRNMTITEPFGYSEPGLFDSYNFAGVGGFFGIVGDCKIKNVVFEDAFVSTKNLYRYDNLYMGIVTGLINNESNAEFSDIRINNGEVSALKTIPYDENYQVGAPNTCIGGIVGYAKSSPKIHRVQVNFASDCINYSINSYIGSIVGMANRGIDCSDICSIATIKASTCATNCVGMIGYLSARENNVEISNTYSEIETNTGFYPKGSYNIYYNNLSVLIGKFLNKNTTESTKIENAFGSINPIDKISDFTEPRLELFIVNGNTDIEVVNSYGCTELPESHGFDLEIWDVTDKKKPRLK